MQNKSQPEFQFKPIQMLPWIRQHNKECRSDQLINLINKICVESPLKIDIDKIQEPIQSYNLALVITICNKKISCIEDVNLQALELSPIAEIINNKLIDALQYKNQLSDLKPQWFDEVTLRGSDKVKEILSYEIPPSLILELIQDTSIYKVDNNLAKNPQYPHVCQTVDYSTTIVMSNYKVDNRTLNIEISKTEPVNPTPASYTGNEVNIIIVTVILPKLVPDKKNIPDINELSWNVFEELTESLNANGASVKNNIPSKSNKKECQIFGTDSNGETIDLSYEALKKRIESRLLNAYLKDIPPQKDTFKA